MLIINRKKIIFSLLQKNIYKRNNNEIISHKKKTNQQNDNKNKNFQKTSENVYVQSSELDKTQRLSLLNNNVENQQRINDNEINTSESLLKNDTSSKSKIINILYYNSK